MGGLNAYQYCPNPVGWVDPLGLKCKEVSDRILDENGNRIPLGFNNLDEFRQFTNVSSEGLPKGAHIVFKGSSVTDKSCKSFDDRRVSDFDIGLVSDDLFIESLDLGRDFGFKVKTQPDRIGPLEPTQLELLNLKDLQTTLSERQVGLLTSNYRPAF
jgi:hypothetical protein